MVNGEGAVQFSVHEDTREQHFSRVWNQELDEVFSDVAKYYDRANYIASLGLWGWFRNSFLSTIEIPEGAQVLDVCAGTNAVGIAIMDKQPKAVVTAMDRSHAMQEVGRKAAQQKGYHIKSVIGDVHRLPFPDNHFDLVTLQFASRHLRIMDVAQEIIRVLRPGGFFYHSDMLRPANRLVEKLYYSYLKASLTMTARIFSSGPAALNCRDYFIKTLHMFYSASELTELLLQLGYNEVKSKTIMAGMLGFHKAQKSL